MLARAATDPDPPRFHVRRPSRRVVRSGLQDAEHIGEVRQPHAARRMFLAEDHFPIRAVYRSPRPNAPLKRPPRPGCARPRLTPAAREPLGGLATSCGPVVAAGVSLRWWCDEQILFECHRDSNRRGRPQLALISGGVPVRFAIVLRPPGRTGYIAAEPRRLERAFGVDGWLFGSPDQSLNEQTDDLPRGSVPLRL